LKMPGKSKHGATSLDDGSGDDTVVLIDSLAMDGLLGREEQQRPQEDWLSCLCFRGKDGHKHDFAGICPKGHPLVKTEVAGGHTMPCSACEAPVRTVMLCKKCKWGLCTICHQSMAVARPRKVDLDTLPKKAASKASAELTQAAVVLTLELTLADLQAHRKDLRVWFDYELRCLAREKGVCEDALSQLESNVEVTDATGIVYDGYEALLKAKITEEALPIVFKFDTMLTAQREGSFTRSVLV